MRQTRCSPTSPRHEAPRRAAATRVRRCNTRCQQKSDAQASTSRRSVAGTDQARGGSAHRRCLAMTALVRVIATHSCAGRAPPRRQHERAGCAGVDASQLSGKSHASGQRRQTHRAQLGDEHAWRAQHGPSSRRRACAAVRPYNAHAAAERRTTRRRGSWEKTQDHTRQRAAERREGGWASANVAAVRRASKLVRALLLTRRMVAARPRAAAALLVWRSDTKTSAVCRAGSVRVRRGRRCLAKRSVRVRRRSRVTPCSPSFAPQPPAGASRLQRAPERRTCQRHTCCTRLHALVVLSSAQQQWRGRVSARGQAAHTQARWRRGHTRLHSVYMRAASEFAGEFGFGSHSSDWMDVSTADTSYMGLQLFCRMSRQMPPSA
jgi:hypothetical protein